MSTIDDLKQKTLDTLINEVGKEDVQASMIAQAVNFMKTFSGDFDSTPISSNPSELSPSLSRYKDQMSFGNA
jgi:hypothetical protein